LQGNVRKSACEVFQIDEQGFHDMNCKPAVGVTSNSKFPLCRQGENKLRLGFRKRLSRFFQGLQEGGQGGFAHAMQAHHFGLSATGQFMHRGDAGTFQSAAGRGVEARQKTRVGFVRGFANRACRAI
jgi:hypothetical protein